MWFVTGILFLAGGQASLKRDPVSIAALLLALLPRFPLRSSEQQYHLQAWRHLVVLAMEMRLLLPLDVISRRPLSLEVEVTL